MPKATDSTESIGSPTSTSPLSKVCECIEFGNAMFRELQGKGHTSKRHGKV
jgi:hypothetical protein